MIPWMVYEALLCEEGMQPRRTLLAGIPFVLCWLGGYIPFAAFCVLTSVLLTGATIFYIDPVDTTFVPRLRAFFRSLRPVCLAMIVVLPYVYCLHQFASETNIVNEPSLFFSAHQLSQYAHSVVSVFSRSMAPIGPFFEYNAYLGFVPIILFTLFLLSKKSIASVGDREWRLLKVCGLGYVIILLSTFGPQSVVSDLVYYFVPQIGKMHIYQRFLVPGQILIAFMTAVLLAVVIKTPQTTLIRVLCVIITSLIVFFAYAIGRSTEVAEFLGINDSAVVELMLALFFCLSLVIPRSERFKYVLAIMAIVLPTLNMMYRETSGPNFNYADRSKLLAISLNPDERQKFLDYLKRFSDKAVIKYVDLTFLWDRDRPGLEPFPKSFPY